MLLQQTPCHAVAADTMLLQQTPRCSSRHHAVAAGKCCCSRQRAVAQTLCFCCRASCSICSRHSAVADGTVLLLLQKTTYSTVAVGTVMLHSRHRAAVTVGAMQLQAGCALAASTVLLQQASCCCNRYTVVEQTISLQKMTNTCFFLQNHYRVVVSGIGIAR
jgi:hypothetical protein